MRWEASSDLLLVPKSHSILCINWYLTLLSGHIWGVAWAVHKQHAC